MIITSLFIGLLHATTTAREWIKLPVRTGTIIGDAIPKPAESFLIPTKKEGFLPPVAYMERHVQGDDEADRARVRLEVLNGLGVHPFASSTVELDKKPFRAGEKRDLPASLTSIQSAGEETMLTCLAVVRDGDLLRVLWVQAYQASLVDCKAFVEIARSSALTRK